MKHSTRVRRGRPPASLWYWSDYTSDSGVRSLSLLARGLWLECLAIMHAAPTPGYLVLANGSAPSTKQLARITGATDDEVEIGIREILENGVASYDGEGRIFNRRMVREFSRTKTLSETRAAVGKSGGKESAKKRWGQKPLVDNQECKQNGKQNKQNDFDGKQTGKQNGKQNPESFPVVSNQTADLVVSKSEAKTPLPIPIPFPLPIPSTVPPLPTPPPDPGNLLTSSTSRAPSPIVDGCVWFRMSPEEKLLVESVYRKRNLPAELLPYAVQEVEYWLANGSKSGAKQARRNPTHYKQLYATWVVGKAIEAFNQPNRLNGHKSFGRSASVSVTEHNERFFKEIENYDTATNDSIIEVDGKPVPYDESNQ